MQLQIVLDWIWSLKRMVKLISLILQISLPTLIVLIFLNQEEVVLVKGNGIVAPIQSFTLNTLNGQDTTDTLFATSAPYVLVFAGQIESTIPWDTLLSKLHNKHKLVFIVTADKDRASSLLSKEQILIGDNTMIKTVARVWPTVFVMNGSTIMSKTAYTDLIDVH
jgi:hypothetical protein